MKMAKLARGLLVCLALSTAAAQPAARTKLPWYMQETAMGPGGRLTFLDKPWWPRAKSLPEGGSFYLDLNGDGRPDTLIVRKEGHIIEAINDTGGAPSLDDHVFCAFVVSFKGTGLVDQLIAYIDNDGDGKADEMEVRYFKDGTLRYAWMGENFDGDGAQIYTIQNWAYDGNGKFLSKFRGNTNIYLNKYDPKTDSWTPASECPFSFWDPNSDGRAEIVQRVSAAPLDSNTGNDADYANHKEHVLAPEAVPLSQTGNMNVRLSYNIDPEPRQDPFTKPHFNFGFNMVGAQPYKYPNMFYTNPRRRPPQTVVRIPLTEALNVGLNYPAQQTGFSWDEAREVWRWEGQFWIFEREYMPNTGGPIMRWNMRREYSPDASSRRELYYSDVDKRYHLRGAKSGWLEVGHLVDDKKDLEFRYFDSDGDGYLDTWQVFEGSNPVPVRVTHVSNIRSKAVPLSREFLLQDYNARVLPAAIAEDQTLITALKRVVQDVLAESYETAAAKAEMAERKRYCLDIARELYFLKARDRFYRKTAGLPYATLERSLQQIKGFRNEVLELGPVMGGFTVGDSVHYWDISQKIEKFVESYGEGRMNEAARLAGELAAALQ